MIKPHENRRHMTLFNLSKKPAALCKDGIIFVKDGDHVLHDENTNEIFFHQSKLSWKCILIVVSVDWLACIFQGFAWDILMNIWNALFVGFMFTTIRIHFLTL